MSDRDEVRDQLAHAMGERSRRLPAEFDDEMDYWRELADAVMAIVDPILAERDEAERSAHFWQSQAESWEREHQNTVLPYTSQIEDERDRYRLAWLSARRGRRHAWMEVAAANEAIEPYGECQSNCDCGDHKGPRSCGCHVTGEEARVWIRQLEAERDEARRELAAHVAMHHEHVQRGHQWMRRAETAEAELAAANAKLGPDEPTPSDLQVAPSLGATGTAGVRLMREGIERSRADAAAPSPPVDRETLLLVGAIALNGGDERHALDRWGEMVGCVLDALASAGVVAQQHVPTIDRLLRARDSSRAAGQP